MSVMGVPGPHAAEPLLLAVGLLTCPRKTLPPVRADRLYLTDLSHVMPSSIRDRQATAAKLFLRAAQLQLAEGQYNLAVCYAKGRGVPQDYSRAVELYRKAAGQGHADAMCNLAHCLEKGQGVPQDEEGAFLWFREALEKKGSEAARYHVARCHFRGIGTPHCPSQAAAVLGDRVWELGRSG